MKASEEDPLRAGNRVTYVVNVVIPYHSNPSICFTSEHVTTCPLPSLGLRYNKLKTLSLSSQTTQRTLVESMGLGLFVTVIELHPSPEEIIFKKKKIFFFYQREKV